MDEAIKDEVLVDKTARTAVAILTDKILSLEESVRALQIAVAMLAVGLYLLTRFLPEEVNNVVPK